MQRSACGSAARTIASQRTSGAWLPRSMISSRSASIPIISLDDPETIKSGKLAQAFAEFGCCYLAGALSFRFLSR